MQKIPARGYIDVLDGKVDDVRIYNRALADLEVNTVYWYGIKQGEYAYANSRVPVSSATHFTLNSGSWNDPSIWSNGQVPTTGADVVIHQGHTVDYSGLSEERIRTIRVDGLLNFEHNASSKLVVDYLFVSRSGKLLAGTQDSPVDSNHTIEIVFAPVDASNPEIDTSWDPMQISRGLIVAGEISVYGAEKTGYSILDGDHLAGSDRLAFASVPEDWQVGDSLVVAGTWYDPNGNNADNSAFHDEVVRITSIDRNSGHVFFEHQDIPGHIWLRFDHTTPDRLDANGNPLQIHVANMTRNVRFESEGWESGQVPIEHRGHTMFQHNRTIDIQNAGFYGLGRTDKTEEVNDPVVVNGTLQPGTGTNRRGRYAIHFHRNGADQLDDLSTPVIQGSAVWGSPGWGIVVHDSRAKIEDNVSFDVVGAHYVTEDGNEIAEFKNNLAIKAVGGRPAAMHEGEVNHDRAFDGHGFWFESGFSARAAEGNIVASAASAGFFVWGRLDRTEFLIDVPVGHLPEDLQSIIPAGSEEYDSIKAWQIPLRNFSDNVVTNSRGAMALAGHLRDDTGADFFGIGHNEWGYVDRLTGWNLHGYGIGVNYASHAMIRDSVFLGDLENPIPLGNRALFDVVDGIGFYQMKNSRFIYSIDSQYEGFHTGAIVSQTGGQSLFDADEKDVGAPRIEGGRFANNVVNLDASDGRTGNRSGDTLYTDNAPFTPWAEFAGDISFEIRPDNVAPIATYETEAIGGLAVRFNARASYDPDYYLAWDEGGSNTIASFAWDFDNDGITDDWGRDISHVFDTAGDQTVTLTVYDSDGATDTFQQTIHVQATEYQNVFGPGNGDFSDPFDNNSLFWPSASQYGPGWFFSEWVLDSNNEQLTRSTYAFQPYAHYIAPDRGVHQGELPFSYKFKNNEGDSNPNDFSVTVYGIRGSAFSVSEWTGISSNSSSHPAEITKLYESGSLGGTTTDWNQVETMVDFGVGYDYVIVELEADRDINPSQGDFIGFDDFVLGTGLSEAPTIPTLTIQATDPIAVESGEGAQIVVTSDSVLEQSLLVQYEIRGTASPDDYTPQLTGELFIPAGQSEVTIDLNAFDDPLIEEDEILIIELVDRPEYDLGNQTTASVTISSDDTTLPHVLLGALDTQANEDGDLAVLLFRRGDTSEALTVQYIVDGTASAEDFTDSFTGEVVFEAGQSALLIELSAFDDNLFEGDEYAQISIAESPYYTNGKTVLSILIEDNEEPVPEVTIEVTEAGVSESGNHGQFVVQRSTSDSPMIVDLSYSGTASSDDFELALPERVELSEGQSVAYVSLQAIDDQQAEGTESLIVSLVESTDYTLGTESSVNFAIEDNDGPLLSTVQVASLASTAYESGTNAQLLFSRDTSEGFLTVSYSLSGTASTTDYEPELLGQVTFAPGEQEIAIDIVASDDTEIEQDETLVITLDQNEGYQIGSNAEATILFVSNDFETEPGTVLIDFEQIGSESGARALSRSIEIDGFQIRDQGPGAERDLILFGPESGYDSYQLRSKDWSRSIVIEKADRKAFDFESLDYGAISDASWGQFDAVLTGITTDGSTYETSIYSNTVSLQTLNADWYNLIELTIDFAGHDAGNAYGFIDNLVFSQPGNSQSQSASSAEETNTTQTSDIPADSQAEEPLVSSPTTDPSATEIVPAEQENIESSDSEALLSILDDEPQGESSEGIVVNFGELKETSDQPTTDSLEVEGFLFSDASNRDSGELLIQDWTDNSGLRSSEYDRTISISNTEGEAFDLVSLDYMAISDSPWHAFGATLTGMHADGTRYSTEIASDSHAASTAQLDWTNLTKVYIDFGQGSSKVHGLIENVHLRTSAKESSYEEAVDLALESL